MLRGTAKVMGLRRVMVLIPFLSPRASSYGLIFITPIPFKTARALVDGLKSETILQNDNAIKYFSDVKPVSFEECIKKSVAEVEQNQVISRWCDSSAGNVCDIKYDDTSKAVFEDKKAFGLGDLQPERVFSKIKSIGGKNGWFRYDIFWRILGLIDKFLGGYGLNRGRRDNEDLRIGDSLDFWKVADLKPDKRLLLFSQMKMPGKAWLDFTIDENNLVLTAYFYPNGVLGRFYWYLLMPFHSFILKDIAKSVTKESKY